MAKNMNVIFFDRSTSCGILNVFQIKLDEVGMDKMAIG